ncbi:MAG TPA: 16S rRNA (guanine(527)-N(7))-methyltransferase RsmG [Acidobacteriaceae bacterium]|nr:16S rRNA (guanine(527)-N(7))-methyltransferase RsmG [Acidobacteriaceae bacterium]
MSASDIEHAIREAQLKPLSPEVLAQFEAYLALLLKWNSKLNLTAVRDPVAILRRHFIECIQCAQALPDLPEGATLLDFGSGAGLPGIPIAICRPEIQVTLAESQRKKAGFLREAVRSLGLGSDVFDGRVEDMPTERYFSAVTLRAVDKMAEACRTAITRVTSRGWLILFTTTRTKSKLEASLPEIGRWQELPTSGLDQGMILFGQRIS